MTSRNWLFLFLISILMCICCGGFYIAGRNHQPVARSQDYVPDQPPGSTVLLIAVLPDGTKVYRIDNEKSMIVPALVSLSPSGQMAFSR